MLSYFNVHAKEAVLKSGSQEKLDCLCLSSDGSLCVAGSLNGNLFVWNTFNGELMCKLRCGATGVRQVLLDRWAGLTQQRPEAHRAARGRQGASLGLR